MYKRTILKQVENSLSHFPVTILAGPRQVGKSTLLYNSFLKRGYSYISLDDTRECLTAVHDPIQFLNNHPAPLIIDEAQKAKELFPEIEHRVNEARLTQGSKAANGMYILSGSSSKALLENAKESLAGRVNILTMSPLSLNEIYDRADVPFTIDKQGSVKRANGYSVSQDQLLTHIITGGLPQLYDDPAIPKNQFFYDYIITYIERDLPEILKVQNELQFQNFLMLLAANTGQELVYDNYARQIGISAVTIKEWINSLLKTGIIYLVKPYNAFSVSKRITKRPKYYFFDTGIACYQAGIQTENDLKNSFMKGRFVETYIFNEIRKSFTNNGIEQNFYYYRDSNGNEIDLILERESKLSLIEIKSGTSFSRDDIHAFSLFNVMNGQRGTDALICTTEKPYSIDKNVIVLPVSAI